MTTDELREAFLDFFETRGCVRKPTDTLVPHGDETVLFTPAGMNQFKREFMGIGPLEFTKATTCQKCLRTGDIGNVGVTAYHHTFFEMLGNFSFGDYFKREAIHWAWEFLTKTLRVPKDRLTFTVYLDDDEAFHIWHKEVGVPIDRITRMGEDDNFWPAGAPTQGPNGVCGPCSEIFYHGDGIEEVEIWNLVFTQFNRVGVGQLEPLPKKNIDTGMGLERMAAALQGVPSNFEIDIFRPIVAAAAEALGMAYDPKGPDGVRLRRISDHARTLTFTIHENVKPSNEKQGYIVRRLLRRALLDAYQMGRREPFLSGLVPVVAEAMKGPYPETLESVRRIQTVVKQEEEQFLKNLENGQKLLNDVFRRTRAAGSDVVSGKDAFHLHTTYGIYFEVTESLAADQNLRVDRQAFDLEMVEFGKVSRGSQEAAAVFTTGPLDTLKEVYHHGNDFLGYESQAADARVIGIIEQNTLAQSAQVQVDPTGPPVVLVLDRTPFYGESGGQVGDQGTLRGSGFVFQVQDTRKENDFTLHVGRVTEGLASVGLAVRAEVDSARREAIRRAHSATHLLHHALHVHLGKHAQQAGSKVEPDRLRFDFANPEGVGRDRLKRIEETVNQRVLESAEVSWTVMPIDQARVLGAMALFGEKYPENVRVVQMGDFSKELCGGTHLGNTSQVGLLKIIGEESVSAGTRRITALTGKAALELIRQEEETLGEIAAALKVAPAQTAERVLALLEELKTLKKQAATRKADAPSKISADDLLAGGASIGDALVITSALPGASADDLRQLIDVLRRKRPENLAVLLATATDGKVQLAAGFTADLVAKGLHAGNWLKEVAPVVGGGGGGRPDLAQAGGKYPEKIPAALEKAREALVGKLA